MTVQITHSIWLNTSDLCSFDHLVEVSGLSRETLRDLVDVGAIQPSNHDPENYVFRTECVVVARRARRLRDDFELDNEGLALAMRLLRRIDELEDRLAGANARLGRHGETQGR